MPSVYDKFKLVTDFELRGDQARAIPELVEGLTRGDKCQVLLLSWNAEGGVRPVAIPAGAARGRAGGPRNPMLGEVMSALITMGWRPAEAEQAVSDLEVGDNASLESLLRQALRNMPR